MMILMLISSLLAIGVTASPPDLTTMRQEGTLESDTNQQCDAVNELCGAANSASGRSQGDEELSLLQERILVHTGHAAHSRNDASLSTLETKHETAGSQPEQGSAAHGGNVEKNKPQSIVGTAPLHMSALASKTNKTHGPKMVGTWGGWMVGQQKKYHPRCRWPYPHLEPYFGGYGDKCKSYNGAQHNWFCPDGCVGAIDANGQAAVPYCLKTGTRNVCEDTECPQIWDGHSNWHTESELHYQGARLCRVPDYSSDWIKPRGCMFATPPGWDYKTTVDMVDQSKLCHVGPESGQTVDPTGMWRLVGTNNGEGDITVEIEVGFVSSHSKETTKTEQDTFMTAVTASVSRTLGSAPLTEDGEVDGSTVGAGIDAGVGYAVASKITETVKSASEQSSAHTVEIKCPGWPGWMVWVYQWQVSNGDAALKSENFRCHYSFDGYERAPRCPPNACGSPQLNPYCKPANQTHPAIKFSPEPDTTEYSYGKDPSCHTDGPTDPGCWIFLPNGCPNQAGVSPYDARVWFKDWGNEASHLHRQRCMVERTPAFNGWCGTTGAAAEWLPPDEY